MGTIMSIIGRDMKSQPSLNRPSPSEKRASSLATTPYLPVNESITEKMLIVPWSSRKIIKNAPLTAWMNFLPIDEVKKDIGIN